MAANPSTSTRSIVPPLENGDRLTRYEFELRYQTIPQIRKAELIEGIVYVPAAFRFGRHAEPHSRLMTWLGVYQAFTTGVRVGDNPTVRLDLDNEPQPDAVLFINGGQAKISEDDYIEGAPELIVEVAASSAAYDLHDKKRAYRRNGVQEYLVWRVYENQLDWFCLEKEDLIRQKQVLELFCAQNGWQYETIEDLGSGLNYSKKGLKRLIRLIVDSKVERLVITHKDRLLRFGSELIFSLCVRAACA